MRITMTEAQHQSLFDHLYPGDGMEAVSLALCGRQLTPDGQERLLIREVIPVPYSDCTVRNQDRVTWKTSLLTPIIVKALNEGLAIIKVHSHPTGYSAFSNYDDESDHSIFETVNSALEDGRPHASLIMLPNRRLIGRAIEHDHKFSKVERITVVGDNITIFDNNTTSSSPEHSRRTIQAFGDATYSMLNKLRIGVIGTSGTGSLVIEQLARSGVGEIVGVDPKVVDEKNLNRILNSTQDDSNHKRPKVEVLKRAIEGFGLGTVFTAVQKDLFDEDTIRIIASCDLVFGCMDTAEGRNLLNRLANFYIIPYIDVGVSLDADGKGGITSITGGIHYLQPGGSSLLSRGAISSRQIQAEALYRTDPDEYRDREKVGYVHGVNVDRPAVMPVNMVYAGLAVMEMLARIHGYRYDDSNFSQQYFRLDEGIYVNKQDGIPCPALSRHLGKGDIHPLLDMVL